MENSEHPFQDDENTPEKLDNLQPLDNSLELKQREAEDSLVILQHRLEDAQRRSFEYAMVIEELSIERDCLKSKIFEVEARVREREEELLRRVGDGVREKECLEVEIYEGMREREDLVRKFNVGMKGKQTIFEESELKERNKDLEEGLERGLGLAGSIKECLLRVSECLDEKLGIGLDHGFEGKKENESSIEEDMEGRKEVRELLELLEFVSRLTRSVEGKLSDDHEREEYMMKEVEVCRRRNEELEEGLMRGLEALASVKVSLMRVSEALDEKEMKGDVSDFDEKTEEGKENEAFIDDFGFVSKMAKQVEERLNDYQEKVKKEKRELENSVVSLTEENRDVNALLRIALVEKEAVEKSLNKLKGNNEHKRAPLLQIADWGFQRVGFGFTKKGAAASEQSEPQKKDNEQTSESMASNASTVSDASSECEEEVVSLASTFEKMMKNLRLEIANLRRALEESRSDTERLQRLTEKETQQISEQANYIELLEDRERMLSQNVEQLLMEVKAAEEDVKRWREACELEVVAGKRAVEERDKVIAIQKQELEKLRAALEVSNKKLKSKEELAAAAMAAQSAAERSIQLADSRAAGLCERIEELTRQLEESERKDKNNRRRARRICWPWQALKAVNPANAPNSRVRNLDIRRVLPEMQALLNYRV